MDLHPVIVHFPIAFLSVYCVLELLRFKQLTSLPQWFYLKAFLVLVGGLGALAARTSGERAAHLFFGTEEGRRLIEIHSDWANASTAVFGIIASLYVLAWLVRLNLATVLEDLLLTERSEAYRAAKNFVYSLISQLVSSWLMALLALAGLAAILVTGALGGAIVYGPDADPFVEIIYKLLVSG